MFSDDNKVYQNKKQPESLVYFQLLRQKRIEIKWMCTQ